MFDFSYFIENLSSNFILGHFYKFQSFFMLKKYAMFSISSVPIVSLYLFFLFQNILSQRLFEKYSFQKIIKNYKKYIFRKL